MRMDPDTRKGPGHENGRGHCPIMEKGEPYLIFASLNTTCLRATGSYFFSSSLLVWARAFFFVT